MRAWIFSILVVFFGGATAIPSTAQAAAACGQQKPLPDAQRKFHPGHYVAIGRAEARKGVRDVKTQGVTGIQLRYRWADLEPDRGRYDFSSIASDLDAAQRAGLQLVVLIEDKTFDYQMPTPGYLHDKHTVPTRNRGYMALRWDPEVNEGLKQLVASLGAQFDCDPHFEGVAFQETAVSLDDAKLSEYGYTPEKYRDSITGLLRSATRSLPTSRVFWYMNFLPRKQQYLGDIAQDMIGTGVVMGGPDVLPENQALARRVYPFYDKFSGRLKLFGSMQHNSYREPRSSGPADGSPYWSMEDMFVFARDRLHVDYLFWDYRTKRQPSDSRDWNDAREVIARNPTLR